MTDKEVDDMSCKTQEMYKITGFTKYRVLQHFKRINYLTDIGVLACAIIVQVCC
jgi:hypothetical protein